MDFRLLQDARITSEIQLEPCVYTYTDTYMHACLHAYICIHLYIYIHTYMYMCNIHIHMCTYVCVYIYIYVFFCCRQLLTKRVGGKKWLSMSLA